MLASYGPGSLFGLPPIGSDENAVSAAQRAFMRVMVLGVPINTEGLIELCRLGWLDPNQLRNSAAVDAVIELGANQPCVAQRRYRTKGMPA